MELVSRGAEAEIFRDGDTIIKRRISKDYRIKEIDDSLRKSRTRREAKVISRLPAGVAHPNLIKADDTSITMSFIDGNKVRDILDSQVELSAEIGRVVALMHNSGIIHGDLTTSNMISKDKIFLIDFGLSYFSEKVEDKAVDIHLFRQALESKHYKVCEEAFRQFLEGYRQESGEFSEIIKRYNIVEQRGRNKAKF